MLDKTPFCYSLILYHINLVRIFSLKWGRVVLNNSTIQHPSQTGDRVASNFAFQSRIFPGSSDNNRRSDCNLGLTCKILKNWKLIIGSK